MKKTKRLLSFILSGVMLASSAVFTAQAASDAPTYDIEFVYDVDAEKAMATISIKGGTYGVGRFGLSYNTEALTLVTEDGTVFDVADGNVSDVVIGKATDEYTIVTTEETNLTENLVNTEEGYILSAWYANTKINDETGKDEGYVSAGNDAKVIATVNFALAADIASSENPAVELKAAENLISVYEGSTDGLKGWSNVYVASDAELNKLPTDDVNVSETYTADLSGVKLTLSADRTSITASWKSVDEEELGNIASYNVQVTDKEGNLIASRNVEAIEENRNTQDRYVVKFTSDDGIASSTKYNVTVTPVTKNEKLGIPTSKDVTTSSGNVTGGSSGSTSSGSGASLTYTVTYVAGDGTIPEGQKFRYQVARNGYVSGSPAVVAPEGKVFAGWSVDGNTLISVEVYKITKDITFKAIYVDKEEDTHRPFIVGYPGGEVRADGALTRAEAATIIARASGKFDAEKLYTTTYFTDVTPDHWAYSYIAFVYENNIVNGYENGTFAPDSKITRAEFATIMQRYLGLTLNEDASFTDVGKDHWAVAYIGACKDAGLINGYENGEFRPSNEITRAEAVKILNRATDRIPTASAIDAYIAEKGIPFEDLDTAKWYFYEIMEAAFPHLISYYH